MLTINAAATLANGLQLTANKAVETGSTAFGIIPNATSTDAVYTADLAQFPGIRSGAVYGAVGQGLPTWANHLLTPLLSAGATRITFSAKDANLASYVANWDTMPADGRDYHYIYWHECNRPAGGVSLSAYVAFYDQLFTARRGHPNAARIKIGPCFSWYPAAIGHNESVPWGTFLDAIEPVDFIGWDQYLISGVPNNPTSFASLPISSAADAGVPLIIREFGVDTTFGDSAAATFLHAMRDVYKNAGVDHVNLFNYSNYIAYLSSARPLTFAAWKSIVAAQ